MGSIAGGQLHLVWTYSAQVHQHATIERLAQTYIEALRAPFDDREIDILGYEFILQKLEEYDE